MSRPIGERDPLDAIIERAVEDRREGGPVPEPAEFDDRLKAIDDQRAIGAAALEAWLNRQGREAAQFRERATDIEREIADLVSKAGAP
jgi:hypothetical protein